MRNELIKQLETLPSFASLKNSFRKQLRLGNYYVDYFLPLSKDYHDEKGDDGKQEITSFRLSNERREEIAIEELLGNNGTQFDEFVHDDNIRNDVTEFMREIFKEIIRC